MTEAIGIRPVSSTRRKGESPEERRQLLQSMKVQGDQIERYCAVRDLRLVGVHDEPDVSGHATIDARDALGPALKAAEAGDGPKVIVFAESDRAFLNLKDL